MRLDVNRKQILLHRLYDGYLSSKKERWSHCVTRNGTYSDSEDGDLNSVEPTRRDPHSGYDDASVMEALDKISGGIQVGNEDGLLDKAALGARRQETKVRHIKYEG